MRTMNSHVLRPGGMAALAAAAWCTLAPSGQAQFNTDFTTSSDRVGALVPEQQDSASVPAQRQHVLGTDLGYVASWNSYNIILFGDSLPSIQDPPAASLADELHDDAWGYWYAPGTNLNSTPNMSFWTGYASVPAATIHVLDESGTDLNMSGARTPAGIGSFNEGGWWAVFARGGSAKVCNSTSECTGTCNTSEGCSGFICDTQLGLTPPLLGGHSPGIPCHKSNPACAAVTAGQGGLCRDSSTNNSLQDFNPSGTVPGYAGYALDAAKQRQLITVATTHQVGTNSSMDLTTYQTVEWLTNKFTNVAMRTSENVWNYQRPTGSPESDDVMWIWGRPSYWSKSSKGGEAGLYLAAQTRAALPFVGTGGSTLPLAYRVSSGGGWTLNQEDATPLEAEDGWADGVAGHMSFAYVPGLNKWVMLYGGGIPVSFDFMGGPLPANLSSAQKTDGTIKMRLANAPWGPWSAPVDVVSPLDTNDDICSELSDGQSYWSWPVGWNDRCGGTQTPSQFSFYAPPLITGPGTLYGASIVEAWSTAVDSKNFDIGWFLSTWNPYEVHQMKTRITRP